MRDLEDDLVWLPKRCEHGNLNDSGIVKLLRNTDYRFPACHVRKGSRKFYRWHTAVEDAPAGNRLELPKKKRRKRSDAGVKRGPRNDPKA